MGHLSTTLDSTVLASDIEIEVEGGMFQDCTVQATQWLFAFMKTVVAPLLRRTSKVSESTYQTCQGDYGLHSHSHYITLMSIVYRVIYRYATRRFWWEDEYASIGSVICVLNWVSLSARCHPPDTSSWPIFRDLVLDIYIHEKFPSSHYSHGIPEVSFQLTTIDLDALDGITTGSISTDGPTSMQLRRNMGLNNEQRQFTTTTDQFPITSRLGSLCIVNDPCAPDSQQAITIWHRFFTRATYMIQPQ